MDKIDLLNSRKTNIFLKSAEIRNAISQIIDDNSFVELNTFAFSKNELLNEDLDGLGVITGYATINENPVYIVAQNSKYLNGGLSKAN
jgi:acetyl-CoA carboxylase carboxyltransferase component